MEEVADKLKDELTVTRCQLADETREKESSIKCLNELRNTVMRTEGEKVEMNRILQESKTKIHGL